MIEPTGPFLIKAQKSLAGAESEFNNGRYNNCANRCYYACFQAAIHALLGKRVRPRGKQGRWEHGFVQSEFADKLINRQKVYPADLSDVLMCTMTSRHIADYSEDFLTQKEAARNLDRARRFVGAILSKEGT